jgi:predicted dehydrogenase
VAGVLDFANGAIGTVITSFDVWGHHLPAIEIHGSLGSLQVPDPNSFGGPVRIRFGHGPDSGWEDVPITHPYTENWRSIGVADMACALLSGRKNRASGALGYHVLDIMHAVHDASDAGTHVALESTCERPAGLPLGLREGTLDCQ